MTPEEVAGTGEIIKAADGWAQKFFGPAAEQLGLIFGDQVAAMRERLLNNRTKVGHKINTIMIEQDVVPEQIDSKVLLPLLEGIQAEEDETLQDMWANLFVNYIDREKTLKVVAYPLILRQLSSNEVKILKYIYEVDTKRLDLRFGKIENLDVPYEELTNLKRLLLIEEEVEFKANPRKNSKNGDHGEVVREYKRKYFLTNFALDLLRACERKGS